MDLTELKFKVDTDQLATAVDLLGKVQAGTAALGKVQETQGKAAGKAAKSQKDVATAAEDTEKKMSPLERLLEKLNNQYGDLVKGFTKGEAAIRQQARSYGAAEDALKPFTEALERIKELTKDPFDASVGAIRSVSAELERLQQRGELASRGVSLTTKQLQEYSRIAAEVKGKVIELGLDPKSAAGQEKYNQLLAENRNIYIDLATKANALEQAENQRNTALRTAERANIAAQQANLRMMDDALGLYRQSEAEKSRSLQQRMQLEATTGNAMVELFYKNEQKKKQAFEARMKAEATMNNQAVALYYKNQSSGGASSTAVKTNRELAQSTKWLANEEAKMVSVLNTLNMSQSDNNSLNEKASRSIANYERNLRQAGITGADAAKKLELYRVQQAQIQSMEQKNQGKFLSRALQPQIGDVAVSLAAGQNPLTVLLQQGDQVRGLIAQSGIEGAALQKIMQSAFKDTLVSIKDTAVAMGSVLGGAFISLGKSVTGLVTGPFVAMKGVMTEMNAAGASLSTTMGTAVVAGFRAASVAALAFMRIPIIAGIAALVALGVAAYQSMGQATELSKALALNSAAFNMNRADAIAYAESLGSAERSSSKYVDIITVMAQAGYKAGDNFKLVADSAIDMEKYAGVAIDDTVKKFADLADKPYEGVAKLAKETGKVGPEVIKLVAELERQGKVAEAAAIATKAMADVNSQVVNQIRTDAGYLEQIWTKTVGFLKTLWSGFRDSVLGWGATDSVETQIKGVQERIAAINKGAGIGGNLGAVPAKQKKLLDAQLESLQEQQRMVAKARNADAERAQLASSMVNYQNDINGLMDNQAKRSQAINKATLENNRLVAAGKITEEEALKRIKSIEEKFKDKKEPKSDAQKAAEKEQKALNSAMEKYNDILGVSLDYSSTWNNDVADLDMLLKKQKISQDQYNEARAKLFEQQPYAKKAAKEQSDSAKEFADNQKLINDLIGKGDDLGKGYNSTMEKLESLRGAAGIDPKALDEAIVALKATTPAAKAYQAVLAEYGKTMDDLAISRKSVEDAYKTDFMSDAQKQEFESLQKYQKATEQSEIEFKDNLSKIKGDKDSLEYKESVAKYREMSDAKKQLAKDVYDRERYLQSDLHQMYAAGFDALKGLATDFGKTVTDEFMNFAQTGKSSFEALTSSFGSMVEKMIYDLIRLRIQKQVTGLFDQLITMGVQAMMGPTSSPSTSTSSSIYNVGAGVSSGIGFKPQAQGGAWNNGVQMYAKGGVFDGPTMFQHSGGLGVLGEAGSEAVMPLKRDSSGSLGVVAQVSGGGGSATQVVINNYSSEKATATESVDSRGNRSINVTIGDMVASEVTRSGSSTQNAMRGTFGMNPQLIRR